MFVKQTFCGNNFEVDDRVELVRGHVALIHVEVDRLQSPGDDVGVSVHNQTGAVGVFALLLEGLVTKLRAIFDFLKN